MPGTAFDVFGHFAIGLAASPLKLIPKSGIRMSGNAVQGLCQRNRGERMAAVRWRSECGLSQRQCVGSLGQSCGGESQRCCGELPATEESGEAGMSQMLAWIAVIPSLGGETWGNPQVAW